MTALPARGSVSFTFGPFVLVPEQQLLWENGASVKLGRRAYSILLALVEHQGEVVSKRELISFGWPDLAVDEGNLKVHVATLRSVLRDTLEPPRFIATVVGRGYKFVAAVHSIEPGEALVSLATPHSYAGNLPVRSTQIFGRSNTIRSLANELADCRLLSIVGPGGIGKTTVAIAVAHEALEAYPDGAWLIDLSSIDYAAAVSGAIADAIGLGFEDPDMPAAICNHLRGRTALLVFDNCEHLLDEIACWADRILKCTQRVKLLMTSREPLCMKGERVRRLSRLDLPPAADRMTAEQAMQYSAVQLFVSRASTRCAAFALDDANAPVVVEICRRLDGLALAIERAATRVDTHGVERMLDHLDNRFHMYDRYHTGPERHRTLTAAIDSSYCLLSQTERTILNRLSTIVGAFDLDTAHAVSGTGLDRMTVIDGVACLVAKSLLAVEPTDGQMTYRQINITRAFAREKLIESGEYEDIRQRHALHISHLAEQAMADWHRLSSSKWHAVHGALFDDINEALHWAFSAGTAAPLAVRLTLAALPFWPRLCDGGGAALWPALDARDDVMLHLALSKALRDMPGQIAEARACASRALRIAERSGDANLQSEFMDELYLDLEPAERPRPPWSEQILKQR